MLTVASICNLQQGDDNMGSIRIEEPESYIFSTELDVRISDINYGGHIGHERVLSMTQEARARFLHKHGFSEMDIEGTGLIVCEAAISYKNEAFYGEILKVDMAILNTGSRRCDFVYMISEGATGREIARAKIGVAFFDYNERKSVPIPEKFKSCLLRPGSE